MKKLTAIMLALVLVLAMSASAYAASITIAPPDVNGGNETGITYKAYKIFDATISGEGENAKVAYTIDFNNQFYDTISDSGYFELKELNETTTYIVTPKTSYNDEAAKTLAGKLNAVSEKRDAVTFTYDSEKGVYKSDDILEGYYLITSSVGDALILDTTQNDAFNAKNQYPSLEKTVDKKTAHLGDTVTYTITVKVPADANGQIVVHDTMVGLKYVELVKEVDGVTVDTAPNCVERCTVEFTIDTDIVTDDNDGKVIIEYKAVVTADTAKNEAYLVDGTYTSKPSVPGDVKNYKFDVFKYTKGENDSQVGLAGAGFVLENAEGKYYKYTAATANDAANVEWVDEIDNATEYATTEDNKYTVTFTGLAAGTYTLIEKTVPAGYNAAQNTTVVIDDSGKVKVGETEVQKVDILNSSGSELPSTGGMGTTIFYVVGGLMVTLAVVILVAKKKVGAGK